jgi:hypothetical protein
MWDITCFVLSVKYAHKTHGLMEGGKFDFVLNCYLTNIVDYALEVLGALVLGNG